MKHTIAELMLLLSVAFWGASFALTKPLLDSMGVFTFMASRFVVGGIVLILALSLLGKFKPDKQQIKGGLVTGILLFLAFIFHTYGLKYTTVAKNAFIVGSNVVFVPIILTFLMKQAQSRIVWFSTLVALLGLALVTLDGAQGGLNIGDLITVLGTVIVAFYILRVEVYVKNGNPLNIATVQVLTVGLLSLILAFIFESPITDLSFQALTPLMLRNLLILSLGCTSLAYLMANYAQSIVSASRTALLYVFEPIFGAFLGWLLLGEVVGIQGIVGALLITIATIMPQFTKKPIR